MINVALRCTYGPYYGARILDRYMPGWWNLISLESLDMADPYECIAGQLFYDRSEHDFNGYTWFTSRQPGQDGYITGVSQDLRMGLVPLDCYTDELLNETWREIIIERICQFG